MIHSHVSPMVGPGPIPVGTDLLTAVLATTEFTFVQAGQSLTHAVEDLRALQALFPQLEERLGPQSARNLADLRATLQAELAPVAEVLNAFVDENDQLRLSIRRVAAEVGNLERVVRTIANVAINARIQGNVLIPPRHQVTAFVEALAQMAAAAEQILADLRDNLDQVLRDCPQMQLHVQMLRTILTTRVFAKLKDLTEASEVFERDRAQVAAASTVLAGHMQSAFSEVSRLIMALQVGDSTRQRLERVLDIIDQRLDLAQTGVERPALELAALLARDASGRADHEVSDAIRALDEVRGAASQAISLAGDVYLGRSERNKALLGALTEQAGEMDGDLAEITGRLDIVRQGAAQVEASLGLILEHETSLRRIASHVRLSGLNAVLICAKLGREGDALRELANWLHSLTDESDQIIGRLQELLAETRANIERVGGERVEQLSIKAGQIVTCGKDINYQIADMGQMVASAAALLTRSRMSLPRHLDGGIAVLEQFVASLPDVETVALNCDVAALILPEPALPLDEGAPGAEAMGRLRKRCTMQRERDLFDQVLRVDAPHQPAAAPDAASKAAAPAAADDDLDDIFF